MDALGNLLLTAGDREGAIRILETILALNPPNSKDYQSLLENKNPSLKNSPAAAGDFL